MTGKPGMSDGNSRDRTVSVADFEEPKGPPYSRDRSFSMFDQKPKGAWAGEVEMDLESWGSSEEMESPRSVAKVGERWMKEIARLHSQILRIREEDSHLGEDLGEAKENKMIALHHSHLNVLIFSRPILPASPLSGKTPVKALHRSDSSRWRQVGVDHGTQVNKL